MSRNEFLVEGECPSYQVTLAPHLVMRGNLDSFLQRQSLESSRIGQFGCRALRPSWSNTSARSA
jgi:hypothetical protein